MQSNKIKLINHISPMVLSILILINSSQACYVIEYYKETHDISWSNTAQFYVQPDISIYQQQIVGNWIQ